jgi:hypothetical protein
VKRPAKSVTSAIGLVIFLGLAATASAFIPQVDRTMKEIAKVNRVSGRSKAIQLELTMQVGDAAPIASALLISHPSGLARLEIQGYRGRVDRYLLTGAELLGAKDGRRMDRPQPMLQPFFLLQPSSEATLRAALETFGIDSQWIGLAPCGEQDCFVIGDPRLAAPLPQPPSPAMTDDGDVLEDPLEAPGTLETREMDGELGSDDASLIGGIAGSLELTGPILSFPEDGRIARLWVDTKELQVRRIDRRSGLFVVFGPMISFDKLKVPAWFEIHEPEAQIVRFEVDRAVAVNAPPQAFSQKWLLAPSDPANGMATSAPGTSIDPKPRVPSNPATPREM